MSEAKRYHVTEAGLVEGVALGRLNVVLAADYDVARAREHELQQRLTAADERNDNRNSEIFAQVQSALRRSFSLGQIYWQQADSDSTCQQNKSDQTMEVQEQHILNVLKSLGAALKPAEAQQCQFPQSCPSNCGCDIPDFTPGNGNKARRRAAAIEALKPENQRITPIDHGHKAGFCDCNQGRLPCTCKASAYDGFD